MALAQRGAGADVALVHHSDAGSQYTSFDYTQTLDDHGMFGSIGTVGDAYDKRDRGKLRRQLPQGAREVSSSAAHGSPILGHGARREGPR
jgi:transposase InsO family protein